MTLPADIQREETFAEWRVKINQIIANTFDVSNDLSEIASATVARTNLEMNNYQNIKHKYDATVDPVGTGDALAGYSVGSTWYNETDDQAFHCVAVSGNDATWKSIESIFDVESNKKFDGFLINGEHSNFTDDLNTIVTNSVYGIGTTVTNKPTDFTAGRAFIHTYANTPVSVLYITQIMYGSGTVANSAYKVWMRSYNGTVWTAWDRVDLTKMSKLTDVDLTGVATNDLIKYNAGTWVSFTPVINSLDDTTITAPITNDLLRYNGTKWIDSSFSEVNAILDDLSDVSGTVAGIEGQILMKQSGVWSPTTFNPTPPLNNLSDVTITIPIDNQFLRYDGENWINETITYVINDLTDVDTVTSAPADGEVLGWVAGNNRWEPITYDQLAGTSHSHTLLDDATDDATALTLIKRDVNADFSARYVNADLIGDIRATNGTVVLNNGALGTDATFTGDVTGNLIGNADTASAFNASRSILFTGDVAGSATWDGAGTLTVSNMTVQPDSVALGIDTTGNYIATVSGTANEISVTGTGETANVTIGLPDSVTVASDLIVGGDLIINGSTVTVNSTTMTVDDPIITLGGDTAPVADDNKDRGVEFNYHDGTTPRVGFFGWDDSVNRFSAYHNATNTAEVFAGTLSDAQFGRVFAPLTGNVTGDVYASDGSSVILDNGTNGSDAVFTGSVVGNADSATKWASSRTLNFIGDATGNISFDGGNVISDITLTVVDDLHNHLIANVDGLDTALASKINTVDIDDLPINGAASVPISSNWAYDHTVLFDAHTVSFDAHIASSTGHPRDTRNLAVSAKAVDSDKLDDLDSTQFLRSDTADIKTSGILTFNDSVYATFGTGNDVEFYCDGTNMYTDLNSTGADNWHIRDGTTNRITIGRSTGDLTVTGTLIETSDARVKTNLEKIENAWDKVNNLNGYTFDRLDIKTSRQTGVIAQEVLNVLPEAVTEDENGHLAVAYGNMVGLLIEAIKEQGKEINALKAILAK